MNLAVLGYLLHDILDIEGKVKHCLGGSVAYASLAAARLGLEVGIVSKVGPNFKYFDRLKKIDLSGVARQKLTTVFYNTYRNSERTQRVENIGEKIQPEDIPKDYLKAKAFHLGPVFNEISLEAIRFLRQNSKALITLDPQGFFRGEENSIIFPKEMDYSILDFVDVIKVSEKDCQQNDFQTMKEKCKIVILTKSKQDSTVFFDGKKADIPFFKTNVVDETGAGDVFMAGFIKQFLKSQNPEKSALFASAAASFAVEDFGVNGIGSLEEINERIRQQTIGS